MAEEIAGWCVFGAFAALVWGSGFVAGRLSLQSSLVDREEES